MSGLNKKYSEFMEFAYKTGRVRDVNEAFEEFPVEEEWHKGKIENVLKELDVDYNVYSIGDIVFVKKYVYFDGYEGRNHLFVIIDKNNYAVPIENFCMLISSYLDKLKYESNKLLPKDEMNKLNKDSIVKTNKVYKIYDNQIIFKIGKVDKKKVEEYKRFFFDQES